MVGVQERDPILSRSAEKNTSLSTTDSYHQGSLGESVSLDI
jgi:hypothetical protein